MARANAINMASKHFPQDFFNKKKMTQKNHVAQKTNDESVLTSCEQDKDNFWSFNDNSFHQQSYPKAENSINDYVMKSSLTIDYDRKVEKIDVRLNSLTQKYDNINQSSIETFSDIVSK